MKLLNALAFMAACWLLFFAMVALAKIAERPQHLPRYMVSLFPSAVLLVATVNAHPPKYPVRWLVASGRDTGLALDDLLKGESGASPRLLQAFREATNGVEPTGGYAQATPRGGESTVAVAAAVKEQPRQGTRAGEVTLSARELVPARGLAVTACRQVASLSNPAVLSRDFYQGLIFALILVAPFWSMVGWAIWRWA